MVTTKKNLKKKIRKITKKIRKTSKNFYGGAKKFVLSRPPPMNPERASVNKKMIPTPPKEPKKFLCKNKHELLGFETEFTGHVCDSCGVQNY